MQILDSYKIKIEVKIIFIISSICKKNIFKKYRCNRKYSVFYFENK